MPQILVSKKNEISSLLALCMINYLHDNSTVYVAKKNMEDH